MIKSITSFVFKNKPLKMPKGLIYCNPKNHSYTLVETKTGKVVGEMHAHATEDLYCHYFKDKSQENTFYINSIVINEQNRGWGKYFMDFAKNESYNQNCEGRLSLIAYNRGVSPHTFYKKQGLISSDKDLNNLLDEYIKDNIRPSYVELTDMHLPLNNGQRSIQKNKKSFFKNIVDILKF